MISVKDQISVGAGAIRDVVRVELNGFWEKMALHQPTPGCHRIAFSGSTPQGVFYQQ